MAGVMVYSNSTPLALELLTAAEVIGQEIKTVCINDNAQVQELARAGAEVYKVMNTNVSIWDTGSVAEVLSGAAEKLGVNVMLLSSDRRGKELAGRLAQKLNAGCLTDIKAVRLKDSAIECERNSLGGATVAVQVVKSSRQVLAISPGTFKPSAKDNAGSINDLIIDAAKSRVRLVKRVEKSKDQVDIQSARVLVVVGCGVEESNIPVIESIAYHLGGTVACSKPVATDRRWYPEDRVIGLSGKICKPELALALGVSGQVQFMVGIRDAGILVSINNDENAPINKMADYFLVADLKEVLPELQRLLTM